VGERFDAVCVLQPTAPLRRAEHIDACIELLERRGADTVISVLRVPVECHPDWVFVTQANGCLRLFSGAAQPIPRRQELVPAFYREGSVYVTRCAAVLTSQGLYGDCVVGYEMDPEDTVNINGLADWERAERLLGARIAHAS
jgi:CMP-N-acetylneuraminic acid synthetase